MLPPRNGAERWVLTAGRNRLKDLQRSCVLNLIPALTAPPSINIPTFALTSRSLTSHIVTRPGAARIHFNAPSSQGRPCPRTPESGPSL